MSDKIDNSFDEPFGPRLHSNRAFMNQAADKKLLPIERSFKIYNSGFTGATSGAMGAGDRGFGQFVPDWTGNPHDSNDYVFRWRQYCHLYEISWEARKIIRIPVEDALRKPWEVEGIDEDFKKKIGFRFKQLGLHTTLESCLMLEGLLGGCLMFLGLESRSDDTSVPYSIQEASNLRFANRIPISRVARVSWDTNPLSEHYMRPTEFLVNGETVHTSRCLVFDGNPLFDPYDFALTNFRSNLAGFGPSKLAPVWDDIVRAVGTRQAAYQLIQTNNAIIMAISDLADMGSTNPGAERLKELRDVANQLSVYKAALIQKDKVDITQSAASFGSVPELMLTTLQVLSAASDIPATRFLGQAPGGLNATGESDLENYYNVIDAYQRQHIEPKLRKLYDIIGFSIDREQWSKQRQTLNFKFPPLWNLSELEEADMHAKEVDTVMKTWEAGFMTDEQAIEELNTLQCFNVKLTGVEKDLMDELGGGPDGSSTPPEPEGGGQPTGQGSQNAFQRLKNMANNRNVLLISKAGSNPDTIDLAQFEKGLAVEQEHAASVAQDAEPNDQVQIARIVLDHLNEDLDYYTKLERVENKNPNVEEHGTYSFPNGQKQTTVKWIPNNQYYSYEHNTGKVYQSYSRTFGAEKRQVDRELTGKIAQEIKSHFQNSRFRWIDKYSAINSATVRFGKGMTLKGCVIAVMEEGEERGFYRGEPSAYTFEQFRKEVAENIKRSGYLDGDDAAKVRFNNTAFAQADLNFNAQQAATSEQNPLKAPSQKQAQSGNYKKGTIRMHGLKIAVENPAGSIRRGTDEQGKDWEQKFNHHYGYIKATQGADGDAVDVFIGPDLNSPYVAIIEQLNLATRLFDEHKVMLGFSGRDHAISGYLSNYDESGKDRIGGVNEMTIDDFKQWLKGDTTQSQVINVNVTVPGQPASSKKVEIQRDDEGNMIGATVKEEGE